METTYTNTREKAETKIQKISAEGKISRQAMIGFLSMASIAFGAAIYYCVATKHMDGATFLSGAAVLIAAFAVSTYRSFK